VLEKIFDAISKQQFVAENLLVRRENRLASDELGSGFGGRFASAGVESR